MSHSDHFQRFLFNDHQIRGEIVRLDQSYHNGTAQIDYPPHVKALLGEALAAAVLLSGTLKFSGRLAIQARGNGPVSLLVAEATNDKSVRGVAQFSEDIRDHATVGEAFGQAQLAITIIPDTGRQYQGVVPLDRDQLGECLARYFELSEQLNTWFYLHADDEQVVGLLLQELPAGDDDRDEDAWNRITQLAQTLSPEEFVSLDNTQLLHRLYHEEKVTLYDVEPVQFQCNCSRERMSAGIQSLGADEAYDLIQEQEILTTECHFCGQKYSFTIKDIHEIFNPGELH